MDYREALSTTTLYQMIKLVHGVHFFTESSRLSLIFPDVIKTTGLWSELATDWPDLITHCKSQIVSRPVKPKGKINILTTCMYLHIASRRIYYKSSFHTLKPKFLDKVIELLSNRLRKTVLCMAEKDFFFSFGSTSYGAWSTYMSGYDQY